MTEWRDDMKNAPKDGTRIMLWRGPASTGVWSEMVIAEWHEDTWAWPDSRDTPSTHGEWSSDDLLDGYSDDSSFTHWMHLPAAPTPTGDSHE